MADADHRVEIGFEGGLILAIKLSGEQAAALEAAVGGGGSGRVELSNEEAAYVVDAGKICYVKHESHVGKIGF
jgi:hypothetical protein